MWLGSLPGSIGDSIPLLNSIDALMDLESLLLVTVFMPGGPVGLTKDWVSIGSSFRWVARMFPSIFDR